ncbi:hypothetical protein [Pseudomonas sichuanensis]|uniref:hypothetical protein n=1 Tax=Pseudomonas sichuanensis TaxID=2213015 RepID=UPI002ACB1932|nr:hypothetical protein [Pseudomonas sichuanensis]
MRFIPQLADDPFTWEILGFREVSPIDSDPAELCLQTFCMSDDARPQRSRRRVKVISLSICAIKYVKPGSRWKNGKRLNHELGFIRSFHFESAKARLITCKKIYSTEEIVQKISNARYPHTAFTRYINHILHKRYGVTTRIPCSEIIRRYLFPTKRYGTSIISGNFDSVAAINNEAHSTRAASPPEKIATQYLKSSPEGLRAARHPFKTLQISHINNFAKREYRPLLLSATFPTEKIVTLKAAVYEGEFWDQIAVQLSWGPTSVQQELELILS